MSKEKKIKNSLSRRAFLKSGTLMMGAVATTMITGCGGESEYTIVEPTPSYSDMPEEWDAEADYIIVGFGGAGAMASIQIMQQRPNHTILALEAQASGGGSTKICGAGTYLGAGTQTQVDAGFTETPDQFYANALAITGEGNDPDLLRVYADNVKATYDALVSAGVQYGTYEPGYHQSPPAGASLVFDNERRPEVLAAAGLSTPVPHAHFALSNGTLPRNQSMWKALEDTATANNNLFISYNTEVKKLIVNNGRVVGVAAEKDGETRYFKALRAVLLSSGGFIKNDEMVNQFIPHAMKCYRGGNPMDTGTGIKMAQAIGADLNNMGCAEDWYPVFANGSELVKSIAVTPAGVRFAPEDLGGPEMGRLVARTHPLSYLVFDKTIYDATPVENRTNFTEYASIADIATATGMDLVALQNTIDQYNSYCDSGVDLQYRKDPSLLQRIETAPYYVQVRVSQAVFTLSCGGIRINPQAQVLRTDGTVIDGLYAAGATTAHINAEHYLAGGGTSGAFAFGRIAGLTMISESIWE